jgi:threonine/homoserine/homoserine lactone efflux protein
MDPSLLIAFAVTFGVAAAVPGPNMAALIARVLGKGRRGILPFCAGMILGDVIWMSVSACGLAALAQAMQPVFLAIRYLGAAYLLWLAWKLWTAPPRVAEEVPVAGEGGRFGLLAGAVALSLGNPKIMLFYVSLLPALVPLETLSSLGLAELMTVMVAVYSLVLCGYVLFALRARRLLRSARAMRVVNRGTGIVMAGAAAAVATP